MHVIGKNTNCYRSACNNCITFKSSSGASFFTPITHFLLNAKQCPNGFIDDLNLVVVGGLFALQHDSIKPHSHVLEQLQEQEWLVIRVFLECKVDPWFPVSEQGFGDPHAAMDAHLMAAVSSIYRWHLAWWHDDRKAPENRLEPLEEFVVLGAGFALGDCRLKWMDT